MSMGTRTAIISFPIKLVAGETEGKEGASVAEETGVDSETVEALTDFIKTTDKQGLQTLSKFAKNPTGLVQNELLGILGKAGIHGALAVAIIGAILASPEIIRAIVKALAVKGAALNQDFHRFFDEEAQLGFARELQYRRSTGLDVVITNDNRSLILIDPGFVTNNLVDVEMTRAIRNNSNTTQYGYTTGM